MYVCPECGSPLKVKSKSSKLEEFSIDYMSGKPERTKARYRNAVDVYCTTDESHIIPDDMQHKVRHFVADYEEN